MSFLPAGYQPKASTGDQSFFKPQDGKNKIRFLSSALIGYEYWTEDKKPIRSKEYPASTPGIKTGVDGKVEHPKEFWAVVVWDYTAEKIAVYSFTQASVKNGLIGLINDEDWGDPTGNYDISINKSGKNMETTYSVVPSNKKPTTKEIKQAFEAAEIDLQMLFFGVPSASQPKQVTNHPYWTSFLSKLEEATDADEITAATAWITKPQRLEEVKLAMGNEIAGTIYDEAGRRKEDLDKAALPY